MADLYLRFGISRVDYVFQKTRCMFNAPERLIGTSSTHNKLWIVYAPCNPTMVDKYPTIFRAVKNLVFVGDDGMTPAMRLGFNRASLGFEGGLSRGAQDPCP